MLTHTVVVERPSVTIGETTSYNPTIGTFGDSGTPDNVSKCLQQNQLPAGELSLSLSLSLSLFFPPLLSIFLLSFSVYITQSCTNEWEHSVYLSTA